LEEFLPHTLNWIDKLQDMMSHLAMSLYCIAMLAGCSIINM